MRFHPFFFGLSVSERDQLAMEANTTRGQLTRVAYGKQIELGLADVLVALGGGKLTLDDLPLTANAQKQRLIRERAAGHADADSVRVAHASSTE